MFWNCKNFPASLLSMKSCAYMFFLLRIISDDELRAANRRWSIPLSEVMQAVLDWDFCVSETRCIFSFLTVVVRFWSVIVVLSPKITGEDTLELHLTKRKEQCHLFVLFINTSTLELEMVISLVSPHLHDFGMFPSCPIWSSFIVSLLLLLSPETAGQTKAGRLALRAPCRHLSLRRPPPPSILPFTSSLLKATLTSHYFP